MAGGAIGQVPHGSATTTEAVRRAIQRSEESVRALARYHGISPTTVQKWRKRVHTADAAMGPKAIHSTVLTTEQEAMVVVFRRHTLLPLDDCRYALQVHFSSDMAAEANPESCHPFMRHINVEIDRHWNEAVVPPGPLE